MGSWNRGTTGFPIIVGPRLLSVQLWLRQAQLWADPAVELVGHPWGGHSGFPMARLGGNPDFQTRYDQINPNHPSIIGWCDRPNAINNTLWARLFNTTHLRQIMGQSTRSLWLWIYNSKRSHNQPWKMNSYPPVIKDSNGKYHKIPRYIDELPMKKETLIHREIPIDPHVWCSPSDFFTCSEISSCSDLSSYSSSGAGTQSMERVLPTPWSRSPKISPMCSSELMFTPGFWGGKHLILGY